MKKLLFVFFLLASLTVQAQSRSGIAGVWNEGSEWDVYYTENEWEDDTDGLVETRVTYSLKKADGEYMALEKTVITNGVKGTPQLQGYIRNDNNTMIYVRPVLEDGSIGQECLLYDFSVPFEYGGTVRYGTKDGTVVEEYIDWRKGSLDYYMLNNGDGRCLPAWKGIVYGYGFLGGPMELFLGNQANAADKRPKPSNISHVIFITKGKPKIMRMNATDENGNVIVPYDEMLAHGTSWECLAVQTHPYDDMHVHTVAVERDTLIGSRNCWLVRANDEKKRTTMFEEGRKVYVVEADDVPRVVLNFGLQKNDNLEIGFVLDVGTLENQGRNYRYIHIDSGADCSSNFAGDTTPWAYKLIEGIGASKDYFLYRRILSCGKGFYAYLLRCWKNGTLVYQAPGYETVAGIGGTHAASVPSVYNLQGVMVKKQARMKDIPGSLPKGIYIINGKKYSIK